MGKRKPMPDVPAWARVLDLEAEVASLKRRIENLLEAGRGLAAERDQLRDVCRAHRLTNPTNERN